MKSIWLYLSIIMITSVHGQTPCENGLAAGFPCSGYDLQSQISLSTMNSNRANDSWGWTDPVFGKEYAIVCLNEGTAFIDISDPINPLYLGKLPTENNASTWRDAKTYNNHAFIVSEDPGHGMQVFDLTRLRNVANPPVIFNNDAHFSGFGGTHNIAINEATGYAYVVGGGAFGGGAYFVNIQDPLNPVAAGGYADDGYTHDAQAVIYEGPDSDYTGREIMLGSNENELVIVDVTDKANPVGISAVSYANVSYTHQGWLTEDQRYFILGDETDEINFGFNSRTIIIDLNDLDNPLFHFSYSGATPATDHNGYVKGDRFYLSNNAAGLRVMDISDLENQNMAEVGYFDSYATDNVAGFNGAWSVYPFFESGNIVISDRQSGFLLVKESDILSNEEFSISGFDIIPNPVEDVVSIYSANDPIIFVSIFDTLGRMIFSQQNDGSSTMMVDISSIPNGMYFMCINNGIKKKLLKK